MTEIKACRKAFKHRYVCDMVLEIKELQRRCPFKHKYVSDTALEIREFE